MGWTKWDEVGWDGMNMSTDIECVTNEPSLSPTPHSTEWTNAKGMGPIAIQVTWETESAHEQTRFSPQH